MFIATLFTIAKIRKQLKCPSMDEWIKEMQHMHAMEYYSGIKKDEILPFATCPWMDMEGIMLSEKSQREMNNVCYHLYVESKN